MQVSVLDGNKYTTMCREAGEQCLEILEECRVGPALHLFDIAKRLCLRPSVVDPDTLSALLGT